MKLLPDGAQDHPPLPSSNPYRREKHGTQEDQSREWGVAELETDDGSVRCTGDVAHLSRGEQVSALGRWRTTKWGQEFAAQAILPVVLIPPLRKIESVIDRFAPPRPSRAAVLGLVIRFGKDAATTMARNPFLPVVDKNREVKGWDYGHPAQYAD